MKPLQRVPASDLARLRAALAAALEGGPAVWPVPDAGAASAGEASGAGAAEASADLPAELRAVDDAVALVVETSGSTAAPKRVALTADALVASAEATHEALGGHGQWLLALPGHYIAGAQVLVRSELAGLDPVTVPEGRFTAAGFAAAAATMLPGMPHYASLVPVQLARLVDGADRDPFVAAALRSFDAVLVGGQALGAELAERAEALGARIVRTYGSSETAGGCVYDGRPLEGVRLRVVDGEVQLGGPTLASGYLGDPERTARAFLVERGERWYRTGDLGELLHDGRLRIRGRADDVVISGGVKVALGEVERAIRGLAGFAEAVVVAVRDGEWGERPGVAVEASALAGRGDDAVREQLAAMAAAVDAAGLPPAGRPVRLAALESMPRLDSGKPDRRVVAALLAARA